jgi:4-hydroxyphenylpyruvate dioxygenase
MQYSIATVCLSGTLRQKIEAIAKAGFQGIEIFENDLITHDGSLGELRRLLEDHGLKVLVYQPFRDFEGMPEPLRSRGFARAEQKFELMREIGTDLLMICSNVSPKAIGGIQRAAEDLFELTELAAKQGLRVAYEALSWGRHVNDYRDSWEIVRRANHPALGLTLDTFHIFSRQTELDSIVNIPGDRIFLVQVADAPQLTMDPLSWSRHHRCFPGQGELDLQAFMERLRATGFDGPFSLEIFNDQFRASDPFRHARDAYRSLVYMAQETEPSSKVKSRGLPKADQPTGIDFIEFAVDESEHQQLASFLQKTGFTHVATHKVKQVELWQQSGIRLVINRESQSFAQRYHTEHGLSVCAYGLSCPDVPGLLERATKLGYQVEYADPEHDTHGIAAITGPPGALLYLVDSNDPSPHWEREFVYHSVDPNSYLSRVDHVATTLPLDQVLEATLLYRALFQMQASPSVSLPDPLGLVKSQVMEVEDRSLAMTLNSTLAEKTVVGQIQSRYRGSGVNHIALETSDIFALAKYLEQQGTEVMEVTGHYYDDLAPRFGLSAELIAELRTHHILYDEDEHGHFYQLYTRLFEKRFCFEFVQRTGYRGYGAPNAQIRLTMQARELEQM